MTTRAPEGSGMTGRRGPADLLCGVKEIAVHLGRTPSQVAHWIERSLIPSFKLGGTVCATKSGLDRHFAKLMGETGESREDRGK